MKRREFIHLAGLSLPVAGTAIAMPACQAPKDVEKPVVISTWGHNQKANAAAWKILAQNGKALDAVHKGVMVPEDDPDDQSVGYGGLPDRDGRVTLDAAIMDEQANIGSVMCLEFIRHPISVARLVMEKTPHVQLVGAGALEFALANGFQKENLLTDKSKADWLQWLQTAQYNPLETVSRLQDSIKINHDTIGMLALDGSGNLSGACTTSGMAYKIHGRVGDSPIIGAGLFVDNEVGAASASGVGEEIVRICGSHTVVELMRQGKSPEEACRLTVARLAKLRPEKDLRQLQAGFIALNKSGEYGCFSLTPGFTMAIQTSSGSRVIKAASHFT